MINSKKFIKNTVLYKGHKLIIPPNVKFSKYCDLDPELKAEASRSAYIADHWLCMISGVSSNSKGTVVSVIDYSVNGGIIHVGKIFTLKGHYRKGYATLLLYYVLKSQPYLISVRLFPSSSGSVTDPDCISDNKRLVDFYQNFTYGGKKISFNNY